MSFFEIIMIGIGLSMDAFAASVCKGLCMRKAKAGNILIIALFFGGFQALMPAIGYFLGKQFEVYCFGGSLDCFCSAHVHRRKNDCRCNKRQ